MRRSVWALFVAFFLWAHAGCTGGAASSSDATARDVAPANDASADAPPNAAPCPSEWVASAQGGCGPAVVLCAPDGGAATGACRSVDLSRSHPVGDGGVGESFRLGADGEIAGAWRLPGEAGGPPSPTWMPNAGAGAPDADWHPDAGIPSCPAGWTRTADGLCDPALRTCPEGAESLPGGQCTTTSDIDCPAAPYPDPGPEAMGATIAYVSADAPVSCADRGSQACPWRTISEAIASGRSWMLVRDGTYHEGVEITRDVHLLGRCAARVHIDGPGAGPTILARGASATLDLRGVTVTGAGIGVEVDGGATVQARALRVLRAVRVGVRVQGPSTFDASDIVIADTQPLEGRDGQGAAVDATGALSLARTALQRNATGGVSSSGGSLALRDSIVSETSAPSPGVRSAGVYAEGNARARLERVVIADSTTTGILAVGRESAPVVTVLDVVVRGSRGVARSGASEAAVRMQLGATMEATRMLVDDNRGHGVYIEQAARENGTLGPISHATIRDSVIRGPRESPANSRPVWCTHLEVAAANKGSGALA